MVFKGITEIFSSSLVNSLSLAIQSGLLSSTARIPRALLNNESSIPPARRIEIRRNAQFGANKADIEYFKNLRILTDLDIIRSGQEVDLAFKDLEEIYGPSSRVDLLSWATRVELKLMLARDHTTISYIGIKINIYGNNAKLEIARSRLEKILSKIPASILQTIDGISIFDVQNPEDIYWKYARNYHGDFCSSANGGGREIYYWNSGGAITNNEEGLGTLIHELGHNIDTFLGNGQFWTEINPTWQNAMNRDGKGFISNYSRESNDIREDFADSFKKYMIAKNYFRLLYPNRASIIDNILLTLENGKK